MKGIMINGVPLMRERDTLVKTKSEKFITPVNISLLMFEDINQASQIGGGILIK